MDIVPLILTLPTILGCGLIAGAFFAFSSFVMTALSRLPAAQGLTAMQSINTIVINPVFLGVFLGAAVLCGVQAVVAVLQWNEAGSIFLLVGAIAYILGTFGVTMVFNVPRNEQLAALNPQDPVAADRWAQYVRSWTAWNHVRTVAALLATALLVIGLLQRHAGDHN